MKLHGHPLFGLNKINIKAGNNYIVVGHPCYPVDEISTVVHPGMEIGDVAGQRDFQRIIFIHPKVGEAIKAGNFELIKYTDL